MAYGQNILIAVVMADGGNTFHARKD